MTRVLFLCHGNICRSPMAEYIMKSLTDTVYVESMAVSSEEVGHDIDRRAAAELRKHGISFGRHSARQITREDYEAFDYVVVMEQYNIPRLMRIIGEDDGHKVSRLLDFTPQGGDIDDPWYNGDFTTAYRQIYDGCTALLAHIKSTER